MRDRRRERGNQTLEFTLIGVPLIFILFSIANMSFAMLTMHTVQEAVEQGARYVSTRGSTCSSGTNSCTVTVEQIAGVIASAAAGVSATGVNVSLIPASDTGNTITCNPLSTCLSSCAASCSGSRTTVWPTSTNSDNSPGKDIVISADITVAAPMLMFWPAGHQTAPSIKSSSFHAYSQQRLMF